MNRDIYKYYLYSALSNFLFFLPIIYIFFKNSGLTFTQIFLTEAIFSIAVVLFEVPTGALADYIGRKKSVLVGILMWILSCFVFFIGHGFIAFSIANVFCALGVAFMSGADMALFYEILRKQNKENDYTNINKNNRILTLGLVGYIGINGKFIGGIKELPLIGNEAFILSEQKIHCIHNLRKDNSSLSINVAKTDTEEIPIDLPIDGLFNSHIAIVGNTGSGKSNTLAALFQGLFDIYGNNKGFLENSQFLIFDFNGEYTKEECITKNKKIYNLKTQVDSGDKIPLHTDELFDSETLSILVEATDKTQKPFLKRALRFYKTSKKKENFPSYLRTIIQNKIKTILKMANKDIAYKLLDYLEEILEKFIYEDAIIKNLTSDIEFHSKCETFKIQAFYVLL